VFVVNFLADVLRENIGIVLNLFDKLDVDISFFQILSDVMITSSNVTRPYDEQGVLRHKHRANIVRFHRDWQIDLNPNLSY
jgi:hypothetical protein